MLVCAEREKHTQNLPLMEPTEKSPAVENVLKFDGKAFFHIRFRSRKNDHHAQQPTYRLGGGKSIDRCVQRAAATTNTVKKLS
jgi:hypothetical protein